MGKKHKGENKLGFFATYFHAGARRSKNTHYVRPIRASFEVMRLVAVKYIRIPSFNLNHFLSSSTWFHGLDQLGEIKLISEASFHGTLGIESILESPGPLNPSCLNITSKSPSFPFIPLEE